jgi:hypothetical protein
MTPEQKLAIRTLKEFQADGQDFETAKKNAIMALSTIANVYRDEFNPLISARFAGAVYYLKTLKFLH